MPKKDQSTINTNVAIQLKDALTRHGYSGIQVDLMMAQMAHETNGFKKILAIQNNNFGGVKYNKSLRNVAVPSVNYFAPAKEDDHYIRKPYAQFKNIDDYVDKWIGYANLNKQRKGNNIGTPLQSNNLADYVHRLKLNGYYQDPEAVYEHGMIYWNNQLQKILPNVAQQPYANNFLNTSQKLTNSFLATGRNLQTSTIISIDSARNEILFDGVSMRSSDIVKSAERLNQTISSSGFLQKMYGLHFIEIGKNNLTSKSENHTIENPMILTSSQSKGNNKQPLKQDPKYPNQLWPGLPISFPYIDDNWPYTAKQERLLNNVITPALTQFQIDSGKLHLNGETDTGKSLSSPFNLLDKGNNDKSNSILENMGDSRDTSDFHEDVDTTRASGSDVHPLKKDSYLSPRSSQGININLNAPMIGNFTISTNDTASSLNNIKHEVEQVLLEILHSANAVQ